MLDASSPIVREFLQRTPRSAKLAAEARAVFPSGITHDSRHQLPYPIFIEHAAGSRKWDVDGNEYVDYSGGHGALLMGHNHPQVTAAVAAQLARGTHFGACHEAEVRWGQRVQSLMPTAERVRFTSSGTEATLLAVRLSRAFTGRSKLLRFAGHFHGWHDQVASAVSNRFDGSAPLGVLPEVARAVVIVPPNDEAALAAALRDDSDIAAAIIEPTGGSWGQTPVRPQFLQSLRELTEARGVLLIFDEVISGFRCAPGGAQAVFGIRPDLTTVAKILAGGLPGGAVVGRADVMAALEFPAPGEPPREKVAHHGTYNANPLSAVAGTTTLDLIATTDACQQANDYAARLRARLQQVAADAGMHWRIYGSFSGFHIFLNPENLPLTVEQIEAGDVDYRVIRAPTRPELVHKLRLAMLNRGVEIFTWLGGPTSAVHSDDDLEQTSTAFAGAIADLRAEGETEAS